MAAIAEKPTAQRTLELAEQIEADIRRRNLQAGDRYLKTDETAKMLGVEASAANRALQLLASRKRLVRRPRRGTFVAQPDETELAVRLHRLHILSGDRPRALEVMYQSGELLGLQRELPGVKIQLDVVPEEREEAYLTNVIAEAQKSREPEAFALIGSTIVMQRALLASGLPTVAQARLYPSITGIPFLDSDHHQVGMLASEYLLSRGHRRIVVLVRPQWYLGTQLMTDTVRRAVAAAGLSAQALELRFVPFDHDAARVVIEESLAASAESTGFVAMTKAAGDVVIEVVTERGLQLGRDVSVLTADFPLFADNLPTYPYIERTLSNFEFGTALGNLVKCAVQHGMAATANQLVPVRLQVR